MSDLNDDELEAIGEAFKEMGVKPKASTKEDFQKWLLEFAKATIPKTTTSGGASSIASQEQHITSTILHPPRLPNFSGDKKGDVNFDLWKLLERS